MPILRGDDHKDNTRMIDAELAAWIGLNETIFLEQLNFILKENNTVGQFADGRKWYRDKPRDFVVKYFPFWDEGIVKRAIDNLRADGLILARSDLNKDPKDRSLWYTVHYEAIDRLTGPVERIVNKSAIRKQARQARKPKEDNGNEYTKVQNVLLNNEAQPIAELTSEVHFVPDDKSTLCTSELGTKCTDEKVQNVPTPKDSLPKDSKNKELTPNGVGETPPPEKGVKRKTIIKDSFLELTRLQMPNLKRDSNYWWSQFGEILTLARGDPLLACKWQTEAIGYMQASHLTITGPQSILGMIRALASGQSLKQGATNGHYSKPNQQRNTDPDRIPSWDPHAARRAATGELP